MNEAQELSVPRELNLLLTEISTLDDGVGKLYDRLQSTVLGEIPEDKGEASSPESKSAPCAVAREIQIASQRVSTLSQRVQDMISQLEI